MAMREFTDADGVRWQVWQVNPTQRFSPVRSGRERRLEVAKDFPDDRRSGVERRRVTLTTGLERGWLCFESPTEKRRLTPIPPAWASCDEEQLGRYVAGAATVQRRPGVAEIVDAVLRPPVAS